MIYRPVFSVTLMIPIALGSFAQAASVTPQAIIASLRADVAMLPEVPSWITEVRGAEQPVSPADRAKGVLAYFSVAANYRTTDVGNGITYRVFRDMKSAETYAAGFAVVHNKDFRSAAGAETKFYEIANDTWSRKGRKPFVSANCDIFVSAATPDLMNARCSAEHVELPVVVSGVRIVPARKDASGKYPMDDKAMRELMKLALPLLDSGMLRLDSIERTGR